MSARQLTRDQIRAEMKTHPIADCFPAWSDQDLDWLKKGFKQYLPILITTDGAILDGRARWIVCKELGVEPITKVVEGDLAKLISISCSHNIHRKSLTLADQARAGALEMERLGPSAISYSRPEIREDAKKAFEILTNERRLFDHWQKSSESTDAVYQQYLDRRREREIARVVPRVSINNAGKINVLHQELEDLSRVALQKVLECGSLLTEQKAALKHGEWLPWCKENLKFSDRQARKYIAIWEGRDKLELSSDLGVTDAYRIVSGKRHPSASPAQKAIAAFRKLSEQERAEFLKTIDQGGTP